MVELYLSTTCACLEIGAAATINPDAVLIESPAVTFFTAGVAQLFVETQRTSRQQRLSNEFGSRHDVLSSELRLASRHHADHCVQRAGTRCSCSKDVQV